jgi:hypothetical protein
MTSGHQTLIVLDFGSQVTQLIARRIRELGVYAEILPFDTPIAALRARDPAALILSGGPSSIYAPDAPRLDPEVLELGVPVLGICYGLYVITAALGGEVVAAKEREFGAASAVEAPRGPSRLLGGELVRCGCRTATQGRARCRRAFARSADRALRVRGRWATRSAAVGRAVPPRGHAHRARREVFAASSTRRGFRRDWSPQRSSSRRCRRARARR